jgi:hypothetical protein
LNNYNKRWEHSFLFKVELLGRRVQSCRVSPR